MKMKIELNEQEVLEIVTLFLKKEKCMTIIKPLKINIKQVLVGYHPMDEQYEYIFENISGEVEA
jgi:hypothetical protein